MEGQTSHGGGEGRDEDPDSLNRIWKGLEGRRKGGLVLREGGGPEVVVNSDIARPIVNDGMTEFIQNVPKTS